VSNRVSAMRPPAHPQQNNAPLQSLSSIQQHQQQQQQQQQQAMQPDNKHEPPISPELLRHNPRSQYQPQPSSAFESSNTAMDIQTPIQIPQQQVPSLAAAPQMSSFYHSTFGNPNMSNNSNYATFGDTFPDLDFLESYDPSAQGNGGNDTGAGAAEGVVDLGFGTGFDASHDWSEGGGFDLFDGFFFGGGTG
jgi:hypothetical protein